MRIGSGQTVLALCCTAALGLLLFAAADAAPGQQPAAFCDRGCLQAVAEQYLAAMAAHDRSRAPMARNMRYTENGVVLTLPDGLWRTLTKLGTYRLFVTDPAARSVGFFAKGLENGAPVLIATRLRVINHQITEIESVVARLSSTQGGSSFGRPKGDLLGGEPRPQFLAVLPAAQQRTPAQLAAIVNGYYSGLENNTGDKPPAFAPDCYRLENLTPTANVPLARGAKPSAINFSCARAFALGYYHEDTRLRDRRILAVDTQRGLVYAGAFFDHDATVRSYELKDGRSVTVRNTAPWTWMTQEVFEINGAGKISQVEAVLLSVPYGMRPGWSTGMHLPSLQAQKDHFREY